MPGIASHGGHGKPWMAAHRGQRTRMALGMAAHREQDTRDDGTQDTRGTRYGSTQGTQDTGDGSTWDQAHGDTTCPGRGTCGPSSVSTRHRGLGMAAQGTKGTQVTLHTVLTQDLFPFTRGTRKGNIPESHNTSLRRSCAWQRKKKTTIIQSAFPVLIFISYSFRGDTVLLLDLVESSNVNTLHLKENKGSRQRSPRHFQDILNKRKHSYQGFLHGMR